MISDMTRVSDAANDSNETTEIIWELIKIEVLSYISIFQSLFSQYSVHEGSVLCGGYINSAVSSFDLYV